MEDPSPFEGLKDTLAFHVLNLSKMLLESLSVPPVSGWSQCIVIIKHVFLLFELIHSAEQTLFKCL